MFTHEDYYSRPHGDPDDIPRPGFLLHPSTDVICWSWDYWIYTRAKNGERRFQKLKSISLNSCFKNV